MWRADPTALPESYRVIRRLAEVELTDEVLGRAASIRPRALRSIDAIHLASALSIRRELTAFVAYDKRLLARGPGRAVHRQPGLIRGRGQKAGDSE